AGQAALEPVQASATSQAPASPPATPRHSTPAPLKPFAGQAALEPVQFAAMSQSPAEARHTVPALPGVCWHPPHQVQMSTVQTLPSPQDNWLQLKSATHCPFTSGITMPDESTTPIPADAVCKPSSKSSATISLSVSLNRSAPPMVKSVL